MKGSIYLQSGKLQGSTTVQSAEIQGVQIAAALRTPLVMGGCQYRGIDFLRIAIAAQRLL